MRKIVSWIAVPVGLFFVAVVVVNMYTALTGSSGRAIEVRQTSGIDSVRRTL